MCQEQSDGHRAPPQHQRGGTAGGHANLFLTADQQGALDFDLGMYSVVALWYGQRPPEAQAEGGVEWQGKRGTFFDALSALMRGRWSEGVFAQAGHEDPLAKLPEPRRPSLLDALAPAA